MQKPPTTNLPVSLTPDGPSYGEPFQSGLQMSAIYWWLMEQPDPNNLIQAERDASIPGYFQETSLFGLLVRWDADGSNSSYKLSEMKDWFWGSEADELAFGLGGDDILDGNGGRDFLDGGSGNDTLYGRSGNDVLVGAEGDDVLDDGTGSDRAYGGDGNDILRGGSDGEVDVFDGGTGIDRFIGGDGNDLIDLGIGIRAEAGSLHDLLREIENADGGDGNDVIVGTGGKNVLEGKNGADTLYGLGGDDVLIGGHDSSSDVLYGGQGNDELTLFAQGFGGDGDDILSAGQDMTGGAGHDRFVIAGVNVITDFTPGEDTLDFISLGSNYYARFSSSAELLDAMQETAAGLSISFEVVWPDGDVEISTLMLQGISRADILPGDIWW